MSKETEKAGGNCQLNSHYNGSISSSHDRIYFQKHVTKEIKSRPIWCEETCRIRGEQEFPLNDYFVDYLSCRLSKQLRFKSR